MTINQLIKERKKFMRVLNAQMRLIDSAQEKSERLIRSVVRRKSKVPEEQDLASLADQANVIAQAFQRYLDLLRGGFPE